MEINKVIIPAAGLGTRFLPLTKVLPKQLLPVVDAPMIKHIVDEAVKSDISQIVFILDDNNNDIISCFKKKRKLETTLKKHGKDDLLKALKEFDKDFSSASFSVAIQSKPKGDGDAILQAEALMGKDPFGVMFSDDIFYSKTPVLAQMKKIFETSGKPIIGLKKVPMDKVSSYGIVEVEKIANRLYKIKGFVEKPAKGDAPSDLAACGRYILTPDIFGYLKKAAPTKKGEVILAEAIKGMLKDGKIIFGYELEGEWLECGKKEDWLKSNLFLCLKHPEYGPMLKKYLKTIE